MDLKNGNKVNMEQSGLISTGQSENVDAQAEQPVNALYDPERDDAGTQSAERTSMQSRKKLLEEGANSFAGFLYWTHVIGVIFLIVGFVAPGWLTIKTRQTVLEEYGTSLTSKLVFQDYSLWYITQCTFSDDVMICDSITYRLINAALRGTCGSCHKLRINEYETESFMVYSGAGLVFSYGEFVRAQVLYTLGILIAVGSFREFRSIRINIKKAIDVNMTTKAWVFLLLTESLCGAYFLAASILDANIDISSLFCFLSSVYVSFDELQHREWGSNAGWIRVSCVRRDTDGVGDLYDPSSNHLLQEQQECLSLLFRNGVRET
ncbi:uncharacterized protein LOC132757797 isoform X2 [Ruditapes philippinarum]|uniref:uncharacterized protein LOC132757797 isoform X2 n=1 Tax=Ruditapes philippinarum TaxID=129788 RepID=UPI00295C0AF7|nr:uncharacterized protein LOC132757797 isoform X2 [Ruditapes philippinarum]